MQNGGKLFFFFFLKKLKKKKKKTPFSPLPSHLDSLARGGRALQQQFMAAEGGF
jgi:hypothetical protein